SGNVERIDNAGGLVGAWFSSVFLFYFGFLAYLFPVLVGYAGWMIFRGRRQQENPAGMRHAMFTGLGFILTIAAGCGIATLHFGGMETDLPANPGGILGDIVSNSLIAPFSFIGTSLFLVALFLTGISLFTGLSWLALVDSV